MIPSLLSTKKTKTTRIEFVVRHQHQRQRQQHLRRRRRRDWPTSLTGQSEHTFESRRPEQHSAKFYVIFCHFLSFFGPVHLLRSFSRHWIVCFWSDIDKEQNEKFKNTLQQSKVKLRVDSFTPKTKLSWSWNWRRRRHAIGKKELMSRRAAFHQLP